MIFSIKKLTSNFGLVFVLVLLCFSANAAGTDSSSENYMDTYKEAKKIIARAEKMEKKRKNY